MPQVSLPKPVRLERAGYASRAGFVACALSVAYFCATFPFLSWLPLTGGMEANVIICAREAVRDGHWFPGTQNGAPRIRKPPLAHWTTAAGMLATPQWSAETAARWPTLLEASAAVGGAVLLGSLVIGSEGAAASGLITGTFLLFLIYARKASYDTQLVLWVTLADVCLAAALFYRRKAGLVGAGVALGIAVMTKGPVALLLSVVPAVAYAIVRRWRRWDDGGSSGTVPTGVIPDPRTDRTRWVIAVLTGTALFFAITLPWTLLVARRHPNAWHIWVGQVARQGDRIRGGGSWLSYLVMLPMLWPWTIWVLVGAVAAVRGRGPDARRATAVVIWTVVPLAIMTLFPGRRARYALPLVAPAAVLAAYGIRVAAPDPGSAGRVLRTAHWVSLVVPVVLGATASASGMRAFQALGGGPSMSYTVALSGAVAVTLIALVAARQPRGAGVVYGSVACMAVAYPLALRAYATMPSALPESDKFIKAIVAAHPDAVYYSTWPAYHDPPLEMVIYADRVLWTVGDVGRIRAANCEQVALRLEPADRSPPPPPFRLMGRCVVDHRLWGAYLLPATPSAPPPTLPPLLPGVAADRPLLR